MGHRRGRAARAHLKRTGAAVSTETLPQALQAGIVAQFGAGTKLLILAASAPVNIVAIQIGSSNKRIVLSGAQQGFKYDGSQDGGFDLLQVTSAVDQAGFVIVVGDDDVSYPNAVQITGGSVTVAPATGVVDQAPVLTIAGQTALFAANGARKRITVFSDPANANNAVVYIRAAGKTNNLGFMTPGQSLEFDGTYAADVDAAVAGDSLYLFEEE